MFFSIKLQKFLSKLHVYTKAAYNTIFVDGFTSEKFTLFLKVFYINESKLNKAERDLLAMFLDEFKRMSKKADDETQQVIMYFVQKTLLECLFNDMRQTNNLIPAFIAKKSLSLSAEVSESYKKCGQGDLYTRGSYNLFAGHLLMVFAGVGLLIIDSYNPRYNNLQVINLTGILFFACLSYEYLPKNISIDPPPEILAMLLKQQNKSDKKDDSQKLSTTNPALISNVSKKLKSKVPSRCKKCMKLAVAVPVGIFSAITFVGKNVFITFKSVTGKLKCKRTTPDVSDMDLFGPETREPEKTKPVRPKIRSVTIQPHRTEVTEDSPANFDASYPYRRAIYPALQRVLTKPAANTESKATDMKATTSLLQMQTIVHRKKQFMGSRVGIKANSVENFSGRQVSARNQPK